MPRIRGFCIVGLLNLLDGVGAQSYCDTAQVMVTRPVVEFAGVFSRTNRMWNDRPHYTNAQGSHLYYYDANRGGQYSWNFDDRDQIFEGEPGEMNWARGGWFTDDFQTIGPSVPEGRYDIHDFDGAGGQASVTIECVRIATAFCDTAQIHISQPVMGFGGIYTRQNELWNDKPYYMKDEDGKVLFFYPGGLGTHAKWNFDDHAVDGTADVHSGGYVDIAGAADVAAPSGAFMIRNFAMGEGEAVANIDCISNAEHLCATQILRVEHAVDEYGGLYRRSQNRWNNKPHYSNQQGGHLYFDDAFEGGACRWSFDNRSQADLTEPGSEDWTRGGYITTCNAPETGAPEGKYLLHSTSDSFDDNVISIHCVEGLVTSTTTLQPLPTASAGPAPSGDAAPEHGRVVERSPGVPWMRILIALAMLGAAGFLFVQMRTRRRQEEDDDDDLFGRHFHRDPQDMERLNLENQDGI